jgi:hypothetical protein
MSAVVYRKEQVAGTEVLLAQLRSDLGRLPGHRLHWQNLKSHSQRLHASRSVGSSAFLTISSIVVCKRLFTQGTMPHEDVAYLYTFRLCSSGFRGSPVAIKTFSATRWAM